VRLDVVPWRGPAVLTPDFARTIDLAAFVPSRLIATLAGPLDLVRVEPPIDPGEDRQYLFHPVVAHRDPGSAWIRELVLRVGWGL